MYISRRQLLRKSALGLGSLAAFDLLSRQQTQGASNDSLHYSPRARRIIYIFLEGGLSQIDSYDYKPALNRYAGQSLPKSIIPPKFTFAPQGTVIPSPFSWQRYGERETWASDLFPEVNRHHIDDLCFLHSLHHQSNDHVTAKTVLHTGVPIEVRPTLGSWLIYGLGTENENLPGYIDIAPTDANRPTAFLPNQYIGTALPRQEKNRGDLIWENLKPRFEHQKKHISFVESLSLDQQDSDPAENAISDMEMAFRMQMEAPKTMDLSKETAATKKLYGIGEEPTDEFGKALLLARRFAEAGVRYVTVNHATTRYGNLWDQHSELEKGHRGNACAVDKPISGLLYDLKKRGLLDDTLVMCGSEFGRTPTFEFFDGATGRHQNGRDHNPHGFTMWFAGGGAKPGCHYGATDDFGYYAVHQKVGIHDLHATILKIMGIDHERLTYHHGGRDFRITDVYGDPVDDILT